MTIRKISTLPLLALVLVAGSIGTAEATQTVYLDPIPDDPTASGTALIAVMNGLDNPSDGNRYLVKLGPGIFDLGDQGLMMRAWVDFEGSGAERTIIRAAGSSDQSRGTVNLAYNSEIRDCSVESYDGAYAIAIMAGQGNSNTRVIDVKTRTLGAGHCIGVYLAGNGAPKYIQVRGSEIKCQCTGSNIGIRSSGGFRPNIEDLDIVVSNAQGEENNIGICLDYDSLTGYFNNVDIKTSEPGRGIYITGQSTASQEYQSIGIVRSKINTSGGVAILLEGAVELMTVRSSKIANSRIGVQISTSDTPVDHNEIQFIFSHINGSTYLSYCDGNEDHAHVQFEMSKLEGGPNRHDNNCNLSEKCLGVTDENSNFFSNVCPP